MMTEYDAEYMANTLVDGHKAVVEGQFAILYKGYKTDVADEIDFYVRKNNMWELDVEVSKNDVNAVDSSIMCDIQENCINVEGPLDDKCESTKENELGLQTKLLKDIISEFDSKYKMSKEELQMKVSERLEYLKNIIHVVTKIETLPHNHTEKKGFERTKTQILSQSAGNLRKHTRRTKCRRAAQTAVVQTIA